MIDSLCQINITAWAAAFVIERRVEERGEMTGEKGVEER